MGAWQPLRPFLVSLTVSRQEFRVSGLRLRWLNYGTQGRAEPTRQMASGLSKASGAL